MCQLAWRSGCSAADRMVTSGGGSAADVPPREPKASDWRGGRAAASTSLHPDFSGPAPGLAGDRGGDLAGAAPSEAQRSDLQAGQFAKRASFTRSVKETGPAIPGYGQGPLRVSAGSAGLTVLRQGWKPVRGETPVPRWLDAQRDSPAPRSGEAPGRTRNWQRKTSSPKQRPRNQTHATATSVGPALSRAGGCLRSNRPSRVTRSINQPRTTAPISSAEPPHER